MAQTDAALAIRGFIEDMADILRKESSRKGQALKKGAASRPALFTRIHLLSISNPAKYETSKQKLGELGELLDILLSICGSRRAGLGKLIEKIYSRSSTVIHQARPVLDEEIQVGPLLFGQGETRCLNGVDVLTSFYRTIYPQR